MEKKELVKGIFISIVLLMMSNILFSQSMSNERSKEAKILVFKTIELEKVNYRIEIIIDDYVKMLKKDNICLSSKNKIIWVVVDIPLCNYNDTNELNIRKNYNYSNFVESNFDPEFRFGMRLLKKRNALNNAYTNLEKYFYYNHNGWEVVFLTNTPIEFKNNGKEKIISLNIDRSKNNKKFEDIWVNYDVYNTGISKIKSERVYTRYGDKEYFYSKINKSMSKKYGNNYENH